MVSSGDSITSWQIHDYKGLKSLKLVEGLPIPKLTASNDVLVQVKAASLNVYLEVLMTGKIVRILNIQFIVLSNDVLLVCFF